MREKPKPKRTTPRRWQTRLLDFLRLSSSFEVKVNMSAADCGAYLAEVLPYQDEALRMGLPFPQGLEYTFEVNRNTDRNRFVFTKIYRGIKGGAVDVHMIGELKEESNLEITTIAAKIYPNFYIPVLGFLLICAFLWFYLKPYPAYENSSAISLLSIAMLVFLIPATIVFIIEAFREKRRMKSYFLSHLADKLIVPAGQGQIHAG